MRRSRVESTLVSSVHFTSNRRTCLRRRQKRRWNILSGSSRGSRVKGIGAFNMLGEKEEDFSLYLILRSSKIRRLQRLWRIKVLPWKDLFLSSCLRWSLLEACGENKKDSSGLNLFWEVQKWRGQFVTFVRKAFEETWSSWSCVELITLRENWEEWRWE